MKPRMINQLILNTVTSLTSKHEFLPNTYNLFSNDMKSQGAVSRFEKFDRNVLQNLLRKDKKIDQFDPFGERFIEEPEVEFRVDDKSSLDIPRQKSSKHRDSIFVNKSVPRKVQFSVPIEDNQPTKSNFLSPDTNQQVSRRSTITHNKINADVLRKYSMIAAGNSDIWCLGAVVDDNIDYSTSRRKSVMAAKNIRDR